MSFEDCGMKPGKIFGDPECRPCESCDGSHHFLIGPTPSKGEDDDWDDDFDDMIKELDAPLAIFTCKHCGTFAEAVIVDTGE